MPRPRRRRTRGECGPGCAALRRRRDDRRRRCVAGGSAAGATASGRGRASRGACPDPGRADPAGGRSPPGLDRIRAGRSGVIVRSPTAAAGAPCSPRASGGLGAGASPPRGQGEVSPCGPRGAPTAPRRLFGGKAPSWSRPAEGHPCHDRGAAARGSDAGHAGVAPAGAAQPRSRPSSAISRTAPGATPCRFAMALSSEEPRPRGAAPTRSLTQDSKPTLRNAVSRFWSPGSCEGM